LADVVRDAVRLCEQCTDKRGKPRTVQGVELINAVTRPLPLIEADASRCAQLVFGLLDNALRSTRSGHVRVSASQDDDREVLTLEVQDTGVGMPKDQLDRLFTEGEAAVGFWKRKGSLGLGLAVCRDIALLHGGDISAESEPGSGSVFRVTLPYEMDSPVSAEGDAQSEEDAGIASSGSGRRRRVEPAVNRRQQLRHSSAPAKSSVLRQAPARPAAPANPTVGALAEASGARVPCVGDDRGDCEGAINELGRAGFQAREEEAIKSGKTAAGAVEAEEHAARPRSSGGATARQPQQALDSQRADATDVQEAERESLLQQVLMDNAHLRLDVRMAGERLRREQHERALQSSAVQRLQDTCLQLERELARSHADVAFYRGRGFQHAWPGAPRT